ncbi:hypothetical protein GCM10010832_20780 [Psychroflexus planctonicus]|uniref:Uncharacterized protein n=1 Tax=Psychroflexus planctonicus TaxID=1526575 RepID=A0ABQ1SHM5_9FLAO|nr:hypothetical protein GCM10010832_20780 [Psychroflexus planctonicus]
MKNKYLFTLLKVLAIVIPFYFMFYGPLHDNPENPKMKILWKYVFSGFFAYALIIIMIKYLK